MAENTAGQFIPEIPICSCGKQNSAGQCEHVNPMRIYPQAEPSPTPESGTIRNYVDGCPKCGLRIPTESCQLGAKGYCECESQPVEGEKCPACLMNRDEFCEKWHGKAQQPAEKCDHVQLHLDADRQYHCFNCDAVVMAQQPAPLTIDVEYHKERERRAWAKHCNDQPAPTPAASAKVCLPPQRSVEQYEEIAWVREFADKNKFALESDYFSPTMAMLLREYHAQASAGLRAERDDLKRRFEATMEIQAALAGKEMDMYRDLGLEQGPDGSWHNERAEKAESEVRELRERLKAVQKDAK